jgi:hypothetical protein
MTVVNPKSISGINSITTGSGSDNLLTIHTSDASSTERVRINSSGDVIVGSGITVSPDGDIFATGVCTATTFSGSGANLTDVDVVSDTTPQLGGNLDVNTKNIVFGDSGSASDDRLTFGAGTDLSIYHDGTSNYISSGNGNIILTKASGTEKMIRAIPDGAVELYHDATKKFETTSAGGTLTGDLTVTGIIYGGSHISILDSDGSSDMLKIGADEDLRIYHYNNNTYIRQHTDKPLVIGGTSTGQSLYLSPKDGEYAAVFKPNAEVELYHDNTLQCETSANGLAFPSGKGIDFSATSNATGTMSNELFDDYEEGGWTPVFEGTTTTGTVTYVARIGKYVKIGKKVFWELYINYNSGNGAGYVHISGLPFTTASNSTYPAINIGYVHNYTLRSDHILTGLHANASNYLYFYERPNGGGANVQLNYDGSGSLIMSGHYEAG